MIKKIISGGQTGADRAGLFAAKHCGIETGGWMPNGFYAQDGKHPEFEKIFGIKEHQSPKYPPRTALNVKESDGTVRFATNFDSPGELLTAKMIHQYKKPSLSLDCSLPLDVDSFCKWIADNNIETLNVAGNSEKTSPGITKIVFDFLVSCIQRNLHVNF